MTIFSAILKKLLYNYNFMKKILIFFFLLLPNISNSHPLGQGDYNLDSNFKCISENNLDKEINFGFKKYNYQKKQ